MTSALSQFPEFYFLSAKTKENLSKVLFQIFANSYGSSGDALAVATNESKEKETAMLELVWLTINGTIDAKEAANGLQYLLHDEMKSSEYEAHRSEAVSVLENSVWFWATQTPYDKTENPSEQWKRLCVFTHNLFSQGVFNEVSAKAVLPIALLNYSLNLPEDEDTLNKKFTKIK